MPDTGRLRKSSLTRKQDHWLGTFDAMGSPCELLSRANSEEQAGALVNIVANEAWRIEDKFSRYLGGNIVDKINTANGKPVEVDDETASLLDFADTLYEMSDGRFDITSGALRQAWTFDGREQSPDQKVIDDALDKVGWQQVAWSRPDLQMAPMMQIDFGGIGKEYAVDRAAALVGENSNAAAMVNFGGDLVVISGQDPSEPWRVGVESVASNTDDPDHIIQLRQGALATSGDSRRFVTHKGERYGHVLDARSGWPVRGAPRSITVAADTCTQAGMLATLAMLMGPDAEAYLDEQAVQYWCFRGE